MHWKFTTELSWRIKKIDVLKWAVYKWRENAYFLPLFKDALQSAGLCTAQEEKYLLRQLTEYTSQFQQVFWFKAWKLFTAH